MEDRTRKQLEKLTGDLKTIIARGHDTLLHIDRVLKGENPVGELFDFWKTQWRATYRADYVFENRKDAGQFNRLLKALPVGVVKRLLLAYLRDDDPFLVRNKHPLNLFWSRVNTYRAAAVGPGPAMPSLPVGCQHEPPCSSDAEHTTRRQRELRS